MNLLWRYGCFVYNSGNSGTNLSWQHAVTLKEHPPLVVIVLGYNSIHDMHAKFSTIDS